MAPGSLLLRSFFLYTVLSSILATAQSQGVVRLGSEISAGGNVDPWRSSSGEFAFGFRPLLNQDDRFLLAIWFNKIFEQTIVWYWNDPVPKGSKIQLTGDGHLVLSDPQGLEKWRAETGNQEASARAEMLDTGNFVLINGNDRHIWESFSLPSDTMLPGQRLGVGGNLTSRQSENDYSDGRFQLRMQGDGNLVLYTVFMPTEVVTGAYWASLTFGGDPTLVFHEAGYIYIERGGDNIYNVTMRGLGSGQGSYYMARVDTDGVFRLYNRPKRNYASNADARGCTSAWSIVHMVPQDVCTAIIGDLGSGACGFNSYCENLDGKPNCSCPDGYSFLDPLDRPKGCKPNFPAPSCQPNGWESNFDSVEFKELNNTNWPLSDYEIQRGPFVDKEQCKLLCLRDCFCVAAIYNLDGSCFKKKFPLSNGRKSMDLIGLALIKVPKNNDGTSLGLGPQKKDQSTLVLVVSVLLGGSLFLNLLLLGGTLAAIFVVYRMKLLSAPTTHGLRRYTYKELEEATGGFKQHLGRGSFGTVFKGVLASSVAKRYIAVKRLDVVEKEGEREFTTEVRAIGRTHHKNLVTLLGYCDEGSHRLLVYEYMSNGSLANLLFGLTRPHWSQRMQIAGGIARGLAYLHEECGVQIIHCDVKPQNILLDDGFVPKISDFGLAKLLLSEQSRAARTHARGTVGYFAPEWFRKASVTTKVDAYSFGVVLLEMICCTTSVAFAMKGEEALMDWVYECYRERRLEELVENDEEARGDMRGVERVVMVAIWCIQEDPSLRPTMRRVAQMLEGVTEVSVPPRPSAFIQYSD